MVCPLSLLVVLSFGSSDKLLFHVRIIHSASESSSKHSQFEGVPGINLNGLTDGEDDEEDELPKGSGLGTLGVAERASISDPSDAGPSPADDAASMIKPFHIKTKFLDDDLRNHLAFVSLLPSGVTDPSAVKLKVESDGVAFRVDLAMPNASTDPDEFLKFIDLMSKVMMKLGGESAHCSRKKAFHQAMSMMRASSVATVWRTFKIRLDFVVVEDLLHSQITRLGGSCFLCCEFLAKEKSNCMDGNGLMGNGVVDLDALVNKKK